MYEQGPSPGFGANAGAYMPPSCETSIGSRKAGYEDAIKVAPPRPLEQKEFADVPSSSVEEVRGKMKSGTQVQIIRSRPKHYTTKSSGHMDGADGGDPRRRLADWIGNRCRRTEPVVVVRCRTAFTSLAERLRDDAHIAAVLMPATWDRGT